MIISYDGVDYSVDVLYGFSPLVTRGVSFSESANHTYGVIDRGLNHIETVITVQGDRSTMDALNLNVIKNAQNLYIKLEDGEKIFGPEFWGRAGGDQQLIEVGLISSGLLTRKNLNQFTMSLSIAKSYTALAPYFLDERVTVVGAPTDWEHLRCESGYSYGPSNENKLHWLNDGSYTSTTPLVNVNTVTWNTELTTAEAAVWSYNLTLGTQRLGGIVNPEFMSAPLFRDTNDPTYFYVKSWSMTCNGYDSWKFNFTLLARPNA